MKKFLVNAKKILVIILLTIAVISLVISDIGAKNDFSVGWYKTEATVTAVRRPQGIIFGDFIDDGGVKHTNQPLYLDGKFQQFRAFKNVSQEEIDQFIGTKVPIMYRREEIVSYNTWLMRKISLIIFWLSLAISIYMIKHKKRKEE